MRSFVKVLCVAVVMTIGYQHKTLSLDLENLDRCAKVYNISQRSKDTAPRYQLTNLTVLRNAFNQRISNIQVLVLGKVIVILPDDIKGDRHQRFIVRLANSQTLLVTHNVDISPRVKDLKIGDALYIYGEYEWNSKGGVIHWTHRDPKKKHVDGWIRKNGLIYQ